MMADTVLKLKDYIKTCKPKVVKDEETKLEKIGYPIHDLYSTKVYYG